TARERGCPSGAAQDGAARGGEGRFERRVADDARPARELGQERPRVGEPLRERRARDDRDVTGPRQQERARQREAARALERLDQDGVRLRRRVALDRPLQLGGGTRAGATAQDQVIEVRLETAELGLL